MTTTLTPAELVARIGKPVELIKFIPPGIVMIAVDDRDKVVRIFARHMVEIEALVNGVDTLKIVPVYDPAKVFAFQFRCRKCWGPHLACVDCGEPVEQLMDGDEVLLP